jgi:hypothetical protein
MKKSNILIALILLLSVACTSNNSNSGHTHGPEGDGHTHADDSSHHEQEEFTISEKSEKVMIKDNSEDIITAAINEVSIIIPANKGLEYKFYMKQYEKLKYEWTSESPLYFDFHGEPLDYAVTKYFESYTEGTSDSIKGTMTTPFEGPHGWYWKNNSGNDVSVTLKTQGNYRVIGSKK